MPQKVDSSTRVLDESLEELNAQVKSFSNDVNFILDGDKVPSKPRHAIAVIVNNERARAHLTRVSCTNDHRIVCWATATIASTPSLGLYLNLTFRDGEWRVALKHVRAFDIDEDAIS